jgi:hypothetical protein
MKHDLVCDQLSFLFGSEYHRGRSGQQRGSDHHQNPFALVNYAWRLTVIPINSTLFVTLLSGAGDRLQKQTMVLIR